MITLLFQNTKKGHVLTINNSAGKIHLNNVSGGVVPKTNVPIPWNFLSSFHNAAILCRLFRLCEYLIFVEYARFAFKRCLKKKWPDDYAFFFQDILYFYASILLYYIDEKYAMAQFFLPYIYKYSS